MDGWIWRKAGRQGWMDIYIYREREGEMDGYGGREGEKDGRIAALAVICE